MFSSLNLSCMHELLNFSSDLSVNPKKAGTITANCEIM